MMLAGNEFLRPVTHCLRQAFRILREIPFRERDRSVHEADLCVDLHEESMHVSDLSGCWPPHVTICGKISFSFLSHLFRVRSVAR